MSMDRSLAIAGYGVQLIYNSRNGMVGFPMITNYT
jgi:hypothetical protein